MCNICNAFRPMNADCEYKEFVPNGGFGAPSGLSGGALSAILAPTTDEPAPVMKVDPGDKDTPDAPAGFSTFATINESGDAAANVNTTASMNVGDVFEGEVSFQGDRDWIEVNLVAGQAYSFTVDGIGGNPLNDSFIRIRDADGNILAINDDGEANTGGVFRYGADLDFVATETGTFYIDVGSYVQPGSLQEFYTGEYSVSFDTLVPTAPIGTHDELAAFLEDGYWDGLNIPGVQGHTFATDVITVDISGLNADGQRLALWAMQSFEMLIDVTFNVTNSSNAQITFDDNILGRAYASYQASGDTSVTDSVFINIGSDWIQNDDDVNDYGFQTYIHELGHALGLGHQGQYNGAADYEIDNTFANDSWLMSIMSYFDQNENTLTGSARALVITPMLIDVLALQNMYGVADVSTSPTAGDTVWGKNHTFADAFDGTTLNTNGSYLAAFFDYAVTGLDPNGWFDTSPVAFTITDVGGHDLIDFSFDVTDQIVSLKDETVSTVFNPYFEGRNDNMWIARGTQIEDYYAGTGDDEVTGNEVANLIKGNEGADTLMGEGGDDSLEGGDGNDFMEGGEGADSLRGDDGNDTLEGGEGNDTLIGGIGDDDIKGGAGNDLLIGSAGADTLDGGDAADTYYVFTGDRVTDTGSFGYDRAQVTSPTGQNIDMTGWTGVERVNGGTGDDTINASSQTGSLVLTGGDGEDSIVGGSGSETLIGGAGNDIIVSGNGNNILLGGTGADTYTGGTGNDLFYVDDSGDSVTDGGDGFDRVAINNAAGVNISVGSWTGVERFVGFTGNDTIDGSGAPTTSPLVILGGDGDDSLVGGMGNDIILGGGDNDILIGGDGNDTMQGGTGNDTFTGGDGNDLFYIGESGDSVTDGGDGYDVALINNAAGVSINVGGWTGVERIAGFTGDDTIDATGSTENLILAGADGNDVITGGDGNDTVYAGLNDDNVVGGAGNDAIIASSGDDTLDGGAGDDFLSGGLGADEFMFDELWGDDTISDFEDGTDIIDFSQHAGVTNINDLDITSDGTNTFIALDAGGTDIITLTNFNGILTDADFNFT